MADMIPLLRRTYTYTGIPTITRIPLYPHQLPAPSQISSLSLVFAWEAESGILIDFLETTYVYRLLTLLFPILAIVILFCDVCVLPSTILFLFVLRFYFPAVYRHVR